jgi:quercetin dioxygenase-like cupin family protein
VSAWTLRLTRIPLAPATVRSLARGNRVLYVRDGALDVTHDGAARTVPADSAWHGAGPCSIAGGERGAVVLCWDLLPAGGRRDGDVLLEHAIDLDPSAAWLMRCDRVDFEPAGVALPHRHRGGGIRCLLTGALDVTVGDAPPKAVRPGGAWFESGREPVVAHAAQEPTSFVRVSILPADIRGRSSILYVDPADANRGKPRRYTVWVDEPIALT